MIQAWLLICSIAGMVLIRRCFAAHVRRWGYLALLLAQPAWIVSAITAEPFQWGVFALVVIYTVIWASAAWEAWTAKGGE